MLWKYQIFVICSCSSHDVGEILENMIHLYQEFCSHEDKFKKWTNELTPQKATKKTSIKIPSYCNAMGSWRELPERGKGSGSSEHFWLCLGGAVGEERRLSQKVFLLWQNWLNTSVRLTGQDSGVTANTVFHFNICRQGSQLLFSRSQRGHVTALEVYVFFLDAFQIHSLHF